MYDPKDILTESGYEDYLHELKNLEDTLFFFINNADDLHMGSKEGDNSLDVLYELQSLLPLLKKGDGEVDEDS